MVNNKNKMDKDTIDVVLKFATFAVVVTFAALLTYGVFNFFNTF